MITKAPLLTTVLNEIEIRIFQISFTTLYIHLKYSQKGCYWLLKSRFRYDYSGLILLVDAIFKSCL